MQLNEPKRILLKDGQGNKRLLISYRVVVIRSALVCILMRNSVIQRRSYVYDVLLDIKKVFDNVLLWKLIQEYCVKIGGRLLQLFTIRQGVH